MIGDELRHAVSRPFFLLVTDKDESLTLANEEINKDTVRLLEQFVLATQRQEPVVPHLAVISGMRVEDIHDQVTSRLPIAVRRRFYALGSGGSEYSLPPHDPISGPDYSRTWESDFGKEDYALLIEAIHKSLDELKNEIQKLGFDRDDIAVQERRSKITIEISVKGSLKPAADHLRQNLIAKIQQKQGRNFCLTTITSSSVAVDISLLDKREALQFLIGKFISERAGIAPGEVVSRTLCFGDSENDLPMLNEVADNAGVAVWLGEDRPDNLHSDVFVLPSHLKGPNGFTSVMRQHIEWLDQDAFQSQAL